MSWYTYRLDCELLSPLHVGYHRVGNVQHTRYYVPARNLWGAITEQLTRTGLTVEADTPRGDYQRVGQWLRAHCAFSYLFICRDDVLLCPCYSPDGLRYGYRHESEEQKKECEGWTESGGQGVKKRKNWTEPEFERQYLAAHVTTALDPASTSAQAESLHEVEYIAPYDREGQRTHLRGWVWLDDVGCERLGREGWCEWPTELQVGGERRYGFGRLRLCLHPAQGNGLPAGYSVDGDGNRPSLHIKGGEPVLAHTLVNGVSAQGLIEPLVGRETGHDSGRFGQRLTAACLTWVPGSIVQQAETLIVDEWGTWRTATRDNA